MTDQSPAFARPTKKLPAQAIRLPSHAVQLMRPLPDVTIGSQHLRMTLQRSERNHLAMPFRQALKRNLARNHPKEPRMPKIEGKISPLRIETKLQQRYGRSRNIFPS